MSSSSSSSSSWDGGSLTDDQRGALLPNPRVLMDDRVPTVDAAVPGSMAPSLAAPSAAVRRSQRQPKTITPEEAESRVRRAMRLATQGQKSHNGRGSAAIGEADLAAAYERELLHVFYPQVGAAVPSNPCPTMDGCSVADGLAFVLMENKEPVVVWPVAKGRDMRFL